MYENMTFENMLNEKLNRVSNDVDKRQGSIIYDALAPNSAELAQMYIDLRLTEDRTYADTSTGIDLTRRAAERGINRKPATKAIRKGMFKGAKETPFNVPIGSRFSGDGLNYIVRDRIIDGEFTVECEVPGEVGNRYIGQLIPVEYVNDLISAELVDILIPGDNQESDEHLRKRYFDSLDSQAFGGNIADYKEKVNALDGVGGVKVYPVWNGGGTVKLIIIDSTFSKPSSTLVSQVQTAIDPVPNQGEGVGLAPIGHVVTVEGVDEIIINIESYITLESGYTWEDIKPSTENVINEYLEEMKKSWGESDHSIVRISHIETRILGLTGVLDIQRTRINGTQGNLLLGGTGIPTLGEVMAV